ncbi:MAG: response regulator transcription factor [Anaerolineae bacterium]
MALNVLIVNPDGDFLSALSPLLEKDGHKVSVARDMTAALQALEQSLPGLVVMERVYLEQEGQPFFAKLGQYDGLPIILLTSGSQTGEGVKFASVPKQHELERIEAIVARVKETTSDWRSETLRVGDLVINLAKKQVAFGGRRIQLPPIQFRLLTHLALNVGRVVEYQELLREVWGYQGEDSEARELLKVHIRQVRRKLGWDAAKAEYLQAVRGFGYMLAEPENAE